MTRRVTITFRSINIACSSSFAGPPTPQTLAHLFLQHFQTLLDDHPADMSDAQSRAYLDRVRRALQKFRPLAERQYGSRISPETLCIRYYSEPDGKGMLLCWVPETRIVGL